MNFKIGQVNVKLGLMSVEIFAPIAGKQIQLTIIPQNDNGDVELRLWADGQYVGHASIGGNRIPL